MTLRTKNGGYVASGRNTNLNFFMWGQTLTDLPGGRRCSPRHGRSRDSGHEGLEASATIGELDRGHIAWDKKVNHQRGALPSTGSAERSKKSAAHGGPPWDRHFECKIALEKPVPALRQA